MIQQHLHASLVDYRSRGILLIGSSGSGKSDLALRLIECGGLLVSDDQVLLRHQNDRLMGYPPQILRGLLEVRGVGIVTLPHHEYFPVDVVIELVTEPSYDRLPEPQTLMFLEHKVPKFQFWAFETSVVEKIGLVLSQGLENQ